MSPATETLVKKLVVLATVVGLGSSMAFLLVACGGASTQPRQAAVAAWRALPTAPIKIDQAATAVWTGRQLILFGRRQVTALDAAEPRWHVDAAEAYDPASSKWTRLSPPPGPSYVPNYKAVWTGKEMLAFGAFHSVAYDPKTNSWRTLRKSVGGGIVVWTGREAIGWGGGCCGDAWGNGSAYNPATDTYRDLAPSPLAPSQGPVGAWTGHELVLFSAGFNPGSGKPYPASFARGAAYDPASDTWKRLAPPRFTGLRFGGAAAWDGREILVVGAGAHARSAFAYDPATNRYRRLARLPFGLQGAAAFWTGHRLLVWGGGESARGLVYDPQTDRWSALPAAPLQGSGQTVAWTGRDLIVWGGVIGTPVGTAHPERYPKYLSDGAAFTPAHA